jgi:hypothetical protein
MSNVEKHEKQKLMTHRWETAQTDSDLESA